MAHMICGPNFATRYYFPAEFTGEGPAFRSYMDRILHKVPDEDYPKQILIRSGRKNLPDFFRLDEYYIWPSPLIDKLKNKQPNGIKSFVLELYNKEGIPFKARHQYALIVCQLQIDSIVIGMGDVELGKDSEGHPTLLRRINHPKLFLNKSRLVGAHMWREKWCLSSEIFVSDEFMEDMREYDTRALIFNSNKPAEIVAH